MKHSTLFTLRHSKIWGGENQARTPLRVLFSLLLIAVCGWANAETYKLQQVTDVSEFQDGGLYVFEETYNDQTFVMNNTINSSALQTTTAYDKAGLIGNESYVWTLEATDGGFYLKNVSLSSKSYLNSSNNSTSVLFSTASSVWTFNFCETDQYLLIQDTKNLSNNVGRYLGQNKSSANTTYAYKAYAQSNLHKNDYPHAIIAYKLVADARKETELTITNTPSESVYMDEAVVSPTAKVTSGEADVADALITWSSSNPSVATITDNGTISLVGAGQTTITASYAGNDTYSACSKSYTLTVGGVYASIAELQQGCIAAGSTDIPAKVTFKDAYVVGVKNASNAYISDGTNGVLLYASNHGFNVGDKLDGTVSLTMTLYQTQYEIKGITSSADGLIVTSGNEVTPKETNIGDVTAANYGTLVTLKKVTYNATGKTFSDNEGNSIVLYESTFNVTLSLQDGAEYDVTGVVILYNNTLQISPRSADEVVLQTTKEIPTTKWYTNGDKTEELTSATVNKADGAPSFYLDTNSTGAITYTSSNTEVATINEQGAITLVGYGTTTITATVEADDNYMFSEASFTLSVTDANVDILDNASTVKSTSNTYSDWTTVGNTGAIYIGKSGGDKSSIQLNSTTSTGAGIIITKPVGVVKKISVKWNTGTTSGRTLDVYGSEIAYSTPANLHSSDTQGKKQGSMKYDGTNTYTELNLTETSYNYIGIRSNNSALYLDQIVIEWELGAPVTLKEAGEGYATYCSDKALNFNGTGITAYTASVADDVVTFTPVNGPVPANTGLLLEGEVGAYAIPYADSDIARIEDNALEGVTEETTVDGSIYVLYSGNKGIGFYQTASESFTVGANTAYLPATVAGTNAKVLRMAFADDDNVATGVEAVAAAEGESEILYNVAGQQVGKDYKGIVIKNGKKYLNK